MGYYVSKFNCINVNNDSLQYETFKRASNFIWGEIRANFVIYPYTGNTWSIRTISDQRFKNRKDLLTYNDMIKKVTRPSEIVFIHTKHFIGTATTLESCIEMGMIS